MDETQWTETGKRVAPQSEGGGSLQLEAGVTDASLPQFPHLSQRDGCADGGDA